MGNRRRVIKKMLKNNDRDTTKTLTMKSKTGKILTKVVSLLKGFKFNQ